MSFFLPGNGCVLKPSFRVWLDTKINRQLFDQTVKKDEMDGFLLHLQNQQKQSIMAEDSGLHIYSNRDVDL